VSALALGATAFAVSRAEGDERGERSERQPTIQMGDLPVPVQQAVQQQLQGGSVQRIEKRTDEGRTLYEVHAVRDGSPPRWSSARMGACSVRARRARTMTTTTE
jgi:predicted RNA-binding Zn ribbon-like protein